MSYNLVEGFCIRMLKPFAYHENEKVKSCINGTCSNHGKKLKTKFCDECGSIIDKIKITKRHESLDFRLLIPEDLRYRNGNEDEIFIENQQYDKCSLYVYHEYINDIIDLEDDTDCIDYATINKDSIDDYYTFPEIKAIIEILNEKLGKDYYKIFYGIIPITY